MVSAKRRPQAPRIHAACTLPTQDGVALRGLFIVDKEGVVQHATVNNLGFGRSVDETKRVLQVRGAGGIRTYVGSWAGVMDETECRCRRNMLLMAHLLAGPPW